MTTAKSSAVFKLCSFLTLENEAYIFFLMLQCKILFKSLNDNGPFNHAVFAIQDTSYCAFNSPVVMPQPVCAEFEFLYLRWTFCLIVDSGKMCVCVAVCHRLDLSLFWSSLD